MQKIIFIMLCMFITSVVYAEPNYDRDYIKPSKNIIYRLTSNTAADACVGTLVTPLCALQTLKRCEALDDMACVAKVWDKTPILLYTKPRIINGFISQFYIESITLIPAEKSATDGDVRLTVWEWPCNIYDKPLLCNTDEIAQLKAYFFKKDHGTWHIIKDEWLEIYDPAEWPEEYLK